MVEKSQCYNDSLNSSNDLSNSNQIILKSLSNVIIEEMDGEEEEV